MWLLPPPMPMGRHALLNWLVLVIEAAQTFLRQLLIIFRRRVGKSLSAFRCPCGVIR
jgi:hypothetical protein